MKRLLFTHQHEVIIFDIDNKTIVYRDRKFPQGVQFIPKDIELVKKIIFSRNKISKQMITWIEEANSGKSLEEWTNCKDDDDVAVIIKRDARMRGCVFRREFTDEELKMPVNINDAMLGAVPLSDPETEVN